MSPLCSIAMNYQERVNSNLLSLAEKYRWKGV